MNANQRQGKILARYRKHFLLAAGIPLLSLSLLGASLRPHCLRVRNLQLVEISSTVTVHCVHVNNGGAIRIAAGGTLILDGHNLPHTSTVDGSIILATQSSTLRIAGVDHSLVGDGDIQGLDDGASIRIEDGLTLTSEITIQDQLRITEPIGGAVDTTFVNNGAVRANNCPLCPGGTIEISVDSLGAPTGDWEVSLNQNNVLWFRIGSISMSGNFTLSSGRLDIDANVATSGNLTFTAGKIDVAANKTFQAK